MLITKQVVLETAELEKFDKTVGHNKRSEKVRELIKKFNLEQSSLTGQRHVIEEQLKLDE